MIARHKLSPFYGGKWQSLLSDFKSNKISNQIKKHEESFNFLSVHNFTPKIMADLGHIAVSV
jgi:hypothetical protein